MKTAQFEVWDYLVGDCPECGEEIEDAWGRLNDMTMVDPDFDEGDTMVCPHCDKEFIVEIDQ